MRFNPTNALKLLHFLAWNIFILVCIEAGGILFNSIYVLVDGRNMAHFWNDANLSSLYSYDRNYFYRILILMNIVVFLKAVLLFFIVKIFHDKQLDLASPFNERLANYLNKLPKVILAIGLMSKYGEYTIDILSRKGVQFSSLQDMNLDAGNVWLLMGFILWVISMIFKKGMELQAEADLTV